MRSTIWVPVAFFILFSWFTSQAASTLMRHDHNDYSDAAFLSSMIDHHREAVAMARNLVEESHNSRILTMARAVMAEQEAEIRNMDRMLTALGKAVPQGETMYLAMRHPRQDTPEDTFVTGMLAHHKQGLVLAAQALEFSRSPAIVDLAHNIVREQADQMVMYQSWLASRN